MQSAKSSLEEKHWGDCNCLEISSGHYYGCALLDLERALTKDRQTSMTEFLGKFRI
jgi:hypothetical protein